MPRKAKDEENNKIIEKKAVTKAKKASKTKNVEAKKTESKKANTSKSKTTTKKATVSKDKVPTKKKESSKVSTSKKQTTKALSTTKAVSKSSTSKKQNKSTSRKTSKKVAPVLEYYDLPMSYNETTAKILAQTPFSLFVYWEISEKDSIKLKNQYGEKFFENTTPYLVITNETMNYSFETQINDYANSWYVHINDSDCKYSINLIRKFNIDESNTSKYAHIVSSNEIASPNDHILFDKLGKTVFFKNVKTNIITEKDISSIAFISNIGRIYNIYDLYKEIYSNELDGDKLGIRLSSS